MPLDPAARTVIDAFAASSIELPAASMSATACRRVSVPTASAVRLAETAAPEPELEPHGLRSRA